MRPLLTVVCLCLLATASGVESIPEHLLGVWEYERPSKEEFLAKYGKVIEFLKQQKPDFAFDPDQDIPISDLTLRIGKDQSSFTFEKLTREVAIEAVSVLGNQTLFTIRMLNDGKQTTGTMKGELTGAQLTLVVTDPNNSRVAELPLIKAPAK